MNKLLRCAWSENHDLLQDYHDKEWGVPVYDDRKLFEFLILEGMQAGLSWLTILKRRENYREIFENFDPLKIARYTPRKREVILKNPGIIRHRLKVESIVTNAKAFLTLRDKENNFSDYIWKFVDGEPKVTHLKNEAERAVNTKESDLMSKELKKRGFSFVGSTICYSFMQAVGMVNDHWAQCFRYEKSKKNYPDRHKS
jgi:DNA-3-methyladenine glycosylase I